MINEEISKEAGQAAQTIITYTIKAAKESTYQDYESKKIFKESFYKNNQKEIDQHIRARKENKT